MSEPRSDHSAADDALRLLGRRPLTESELRNKLIALGHTAAAVDEAIDRARRYRYIDDGALAYDFIVHRAARKGHGASRLMRDLERRGVDPELARRAWAEALASGAVDPDRVLRQRVERELDRSGGRLSARDYRRVYNALLRAGFGSQTIRAELDPYLDFPMDGSQLGPGHSGD